MARRYQHHRRQHRRMRYSKRSNKDAGLGFLVLGIIGTIQGAIEGHSGAQFILFCVISIFAIVVVSSIVKSIKLQKHYEKLKLDMVTNGILVADFFNLRKHTNDFAGVYVLYNLSKDKYYVGQSKNVMSRVNNHFTGKGNGDVYADYKYGDEFKINFIDLRNSSYSNLDTLEAFVIKKYNAYDDGYNKTRGNSSSIK